ncbi:MAG: response regulator transcription factor [Bacteroidia bacterium]|nr:response regulator transcription factor [Bacteroidia bacterium]
MLRFLIIDDHAVTRRGIKEILLDAYPQAEIRGLANAEELMKNVVVGNWNMVICDITMPGRSGLEVLAELNREFPKLPVLILSMHTEEEYALRVIKAGGAGFLNKDEAIEDELIKAVDMILAGRKYITASLAERLAMELSFELEKEPHERLSNRELEVFLLLAQGKPTRDIAEQLSLSINTIGTFRRRLLEKMGMKTNAELVAYAIRNNMI